MNHNFISVEYIYRTILFEEMTIFSFKVCRWICGSFPNFEDMHSQNQSKLCFMCCSSQVEKATIWWIECFKMHEDIVLVAKLMCLTINFNLKLAVCNFKKIVNFIARFFLSFGIQIKNVHFSYVFFSPLYYHFSFSLFVCLLKPWAYTGYSCGPLVNNSRLRWRRFLDFSLIFASLVHTNRGQKSGL